MKPIKPKISDHALLRYLERKGILDIESTRKKILTPSVIDAIKSGAKKIRQDGFVFIIKDGTIITVIEHKTDAPPKERD